MHLTFCLTMITCIMSQELHSYTLQ